MACMNVQHAGARYVRSCSCHNAVPTRPTPRSPHIKCNASSSSSSTDVYQGRFGAWTLEQSDINEVNGYRAGINVAAACTAVASLLAFLPADNAAVQPLRDAIASVLDPLALVGAAGLGVSLYLIHIYVAPLKKALLAFWLLGVLGTLYLMATNDTPAALVVLEQPWTTFLVGPMFAALTGVAFKEGFCYGKWEAAGLFGTIPLLFLGHLTQIVNEEGQRGMLAAMVIMLTVFAARKWTQPYHQDVGDKTVFQYLSATPEEQQRMLASSGIRGDDD